MSRLVRPVDARDHVVGPSDATTLLEYGDYQCPACGAAYPIVEEVRALLGDRLRFAFRHFPLSQIHPAALPAAEAAETAGALGDFWGMHHRLFRDQDRLDPDDLRADAVALGLPLDRFEEQLARHAHLARIRDDLHTGIRSGVNGTPTFFIDGVRYDGELDVEALAEAITSAAAI